MAISYLPLRTLDDLAQAVSEGLRIECNSWRNMLPEDRSEPGERDVSELDTYTSCGVRDFPRSESGWIPDSSVGSGYGNGWNADNGKFNMAIRAVIYTEESDNV